MLSIQSLNAAILATKEDLATAYRIVAYLKMDDHTYTHLSARDPEQSDSFYMYPFGLRFEEVTAEQLMKIALDATVLEGKEFQYNETGYLLHGGIYRDRSDVNAIFHLHTPETVAVSTLESGLMPISQWALHFYNRVSYHNYDSLVLQQEKSVQLLEDLGTNNVLMLRNHGFITCGRTIQEAMFYTYHLQKACDTQCKILAMGMPYITPNVETCEKTVDDLLSFEKNLGERDWHAWKRLVSKQK